MTSTVRRAGAFAAVGSIVLAVPLLGEFAAAPFAAIAALAVFVVHDGPVFELFARPGERRERRLYGLIGFTLAATGLVLIAAGTDMPLAVCVGAVLLLAYGNLGARIARTATEAPIASTSAFVASGGLACAGGFALTLWLQGLPVEPAVPWIVFLATSGTFLGALLRTLLFESDDPYVMLSVGLWLWLLAGIAPAVTLEEVGLALGIMVAFGYVSYAMETASIPGMLTGIWMGLVTIVLGGLGWFAVLITFFAIGGLSTKFRYEEKLAAGVAEENEGARGTGNVLANAAVGFAAVIAYAAATAPLALDLPVALPALPGGRTVFLFAFAGSIATAMGDTLASEVGGIFDNVRLITTLDPVEPGTDGGVTWQGELAGLAGATTIALIAVVLFDPVGPAGAGVVIASGVAGMTVDSLLGAVVEGDLVGNSGVNFLATLSGALVAAGAVIALGLV